MGRPLQDVRTCLFCGEPEVAEIFEVWSSSEFMMEACCPDFQEAINEFMAEDPKGAANWLNEKGAGALFKNGVRRVVDNDGQLILDWNLTLAPVSLADAKAFVRAHHRHNKPPAGWRFGMGLRNGVQMVAVLMVGRPVARGLDKDRVVEVNRLCVRSDVPEGLVWNACSMLYGWSAREAQKRGFERIVTYIRADEPGVTLKAAGWAIDGRVKGRSWNCPSRPRMDACEIIDKIRWAKGLKPATRRALDPGRAESAILDKRLPQADAALRELTMSVGLPRAADNLSPNDVVSVP
jgi:hypothetical protein